MGALLADPAYDAENDSRFSLSECESVVSRKAIIILTGRITDVAMSERGPFVKFQPDDRFGFGDFRFGIDLDALTVVANSIGDD